ncbi:replication-associated protein [Torentivirus zocris]|uniref:ATP-dependent helicase Rep n=1 Tax=Crucivirus-184 TaxID=2761236 RepID=A0A7G5M2U4_9VIRU|nr:replication-associated protein [Crucivirus-184]
MPASNATKSRKWCFTMFFDIDKMGPRGPEAKYFEDWECEYLYVGLESCPTSGRLHYQGYVRFANPRALNGVRSLFTHTITGDNGKQKYPGHWEACKGTEEQNVKYCSKESDLIIEWGQSEADLKPDKNQGKRNDIKAVRQMISEGKGMLEVVSEVNSAQAIKIAETMLKYLEPERSWMPEVYWIYGPTGVGKSKLAFSQCERPWVSGETGRWFEGYDAHEDVIFDDFRGDFCKFHVLLRLLDRYPYRIEVKGASRQFLAKRIFITSYHPPHLVYKDRGNEDLAQLGRRICKIIHLLSDSEARSMPGKKIGLEPSDKELIPELGPEQKVGGNTTETPLTPPVFQGAPPPTMFYEGPKRTECSKPHADNLYCKDCVNLALDDFFAEDDSEEPDG